MQVVSLQNRAMGVRCVVAERLLFRVSPHCLARSITWHREPQGPLSWDQTPHELQRQLGNVNFELRDVVTKSKFPAKFRPNDQVECVRLEGRRFQCLYTEGARLWARLCRCCRSLA
jgi:hypothetical protein